MFEPEVGAGYVAVVGADAPAGGQVRAALHREGVAGSRVQLFGSTGGEAVLSEYGDEARLIQEIDLDAIGRARVVFVCDDDAAAAGIADLASPERTIVDLAAAFESDPRRRLVHPGGNGSAVASAPILGVPHEITILLLDILEPLRLGVALDDVTAFVLRPASDFGDRGLDELREQTVRLLNFESVPRDVFARQLAFNVLPHSDLESTAHESEARVAAEMRRLLDWESDRAAIRMAVVPVFLGHTAQIRVRGPFGAEEARSRLREAGVRSTGLERAAPKTPLEVAAEGDTTVVDVSDDRCGGVWIWAVSGELPARRAGLAVRAGLAASGR